MRCVPPAWHASLFLLPYHRALEPFTSLIIPWGQWFFFGCCISSKNLCGWLNKYLLNGIDLEDEKVCEVLGLQRDKRVSTGWNFNNKHLQGRWEIWGSSSYCDKWVFGRQVREGDLKMALCVPHYTIPLF